MTSTSPSPDTECYFIVRADALGIARSTDWRLLNELKHELKA